MEENTMSNVTHDVKNDTLYCFYDLLHAPITFDFLHFLVFADVIRKNRRLSKLMVVISLGEDAAFRKHTEKDHILADTEKMWRVRHVIEPSCWSLPSCVGTWVCLDRAEMVRFHSKIAPHQVFPIGYGPDAPKPAFLINQLVHLHKQNQDVKVFRAPEAATLKIDEWASSVKLERPLVVLSMRYNQVHQWKNADNAVWVDFQKYLLDRGFQVAVIPDTYLVTRGIIPRVSPGAFIFFQGALDFEMRAALYERAFMTISRHGGPAMYNLFRHGSRFLIFQGETVLPSIEEFSRLWGVQWGDQPPWCTEQQRIVYQEDTLQNLIDNAEPILATAPMP
jgi:hypothetical protein